MRRAARMTADGARPTAAASSPFFEWLSNPFERISAAWKRHLVESADNGSPRSVMARAEIVLHGSQHWLNQLMSLVFFASLAVVSFAAVWMVYDIDLATVIRPWVLSIGVGWVLTLLALHALSTCADDAFMRYLPLAALPVAVLNLTQRPAMMAAPTAMTAALPMLVFFVLGAVLFLLARTLDLQPWRMAMPLAAVSAALLAWRWRRLSALTALPAGRLS